MDDLAVRSATLVVLLLALCGLFVAGGAAWPTAPNTPPSYEEFDRNYEDYVGEHVELAATVVETDPVVVEMSYGTGVYESTTYRVELANAPPADVGDDIRFYGEVRPDRTIHVDADRTLVRAPWEMRYMYLISVVGVLLVFARLVNGWRVRPTQLTLVPRERTLYRRLRGENDA